MKLGTLKHAIDHKPIAGDFAIIEAAPPVCPDGGLVVRVVHLSLDPYVGSRLRGRHMGEPAPAPMEGAIPGAIIGQVTESRSTDFVEGDWVHVMEGGWQEFVAVARSRELSPKVGEGLADALDVGEIGF